MKIFSAVWNWCGGHKKATAAIIGALVTLLSKWLPLDQAQQDKVAATIIAYILGQGVADHGKEKAKVVAAADAAAEAALRLTFSSQPEPAGVPSEILPGGGG